MKFIIAAGGTGGHITPGLAIGTMLKNEGHTVIFVGTEHGMEKDLVPKAGFDIKYIHASGLVSGIKGKIEALKNLKLGTKECEKIIDDEKPDMCIGTGGYVTAPLMIAANKKGIHAMIHESNALPGKTTKLMASKIDEVAVGFEETKQKLKKGNIVVTGNPNKMCLNTLTREEAKAKLGINSKLLLIFGGSQGAKKINETIMEIIKNKQFGDYAVIYATGPKNYEDVFKRAALEDRDRYSYVVDNDDSLELYDDKEKKIIIKKFIYNMEEVMKAADLVVCRSGALTCTEIAEVGVASILIPFPFAAENHQLYNAQTLQNVNAGVIIEEKGLTESLLIKAIDEIISDDNILHTMSENSKKLRKGNPIENIKEEIYRILKTL